MAFANVYGMQFPPIPNTEYVIANRSVAMNAAGERMGWIADCPKTGNLRNICFRTASVAAAVDTDARFETLDANGEFPSGTLWGANTNATILAASITSNTWVRSPNMTASAAVTKGQQIAVILVPTGVPGINVRVLAAAGTGGDAPIATPYVVQYLAGAWQDTVAELGWVAGPVMALEYDDGTYAYMPNVIPYSAVATTTYGNGSTPDERALKFTVAAPIRVSGAWIEATIDADCEVILYDSDGTTELEKRVLLPGFGAPAVTGIYNVTFDTSVELLANTAYRLALKPTSASTVILAGMTVDSAAVLDQMAGGQALHLSTRTDAGAWTDTTTQRPFMGLHIDGISSGGGGPLVGGRLVA